MRWLLLATLMACGSDERATTAPAPPTVATPIDAPARPLPPGITAQLRQTICRAQPCGSEMSSITVYRDARGAVKRLVRTYGGCSHSPQLYFAPDGTPTDTMAEKPVVPGSDEAQGFAAQHARQVGGLVEAESISCRE